MPMTGMSYTKPREHAQSDQRYDLTTIWLHWLTVGLVAILWISRPSNRLAPARPIPPRRVVDARGARVDSSSGARDANSVASGIWERPAAGRRGCVALARKGHPLRSLSAASCRSHFGDRQCILYGLRPVWRFDYSAVRQWRSSNRAQHQYIA